MDGLRLPAGNNRSPRRHPLRDRGRNGFDPTACPVGEELGRTEASGIDTQTSHAALTGSTPGNCESRPRLRGVSHQIAFLVALPLGVALALTAHGAVARTAAIAFAASVAAMFGVSSLFHRIV